ncbi:unnamed protein product [Schistocephalus solidus]|uniref:Transmembrane protein n=1 Tax=Schistocephalus solidus TaxID=70667 RepID=A0A183TNA1_SCHSO|nr:unnamed protein product [Schistocephalus solidus]
MGANIIEEDMDKVVKPSVWIFAYVDGRFSFSTRNSHVGRSPHIFYDEGLSVLVDFTVNRLLDELSGPPLSLNTAFFAANQSLAEGQNFRTSTVSTINDELIHGVIETHYVYLNEIASTQSLSKPQLALVQWHAVFYTDASSELKSSRQVMASAQTPPSPSALSLLRQSVAYALLGPRPVALRSILLSLGSPHTEVFSTGLWSSLSVSCGILAGIFVLTCASMLIRWRIIRRRQDQFAHHLPLVDEVGSVLHAGVTVKT